MFYEEELDVPLVLFNEVLDHVLRIDRIFRQPQVSAKPYLALYLSSPPCIRISFTFLLREFDRYPLLRPFAREGAWESVGSLACV